MPFRIPFSILAIVAAATCAAVAPLGAQAPALGAAAAAQRASAATATETEPRASRAAGYARRASAIRSDDLEGLTQLARWCAANGLEREMRRHAEEVLDRDPDHAGARALLGHYKVRGRWLRKDEARRALGFLRFEGRWRLPQEIAYLRRAAARRLTAAEAERARARRVDARIERRLGELQGSSETARTRARDDLLAIAEAEGRPELGRRALWSYGVYRSLWDQYRRQRARAAATGILSINLQHTELLGLDTVPVSFGNGTGGRLQLPRTRSVGVATTVAVPLGFGR